MEKFLRIFFLLFFACGMSKSLKGSDGKIIVWLYDGNKTVLRISEMPELSYADGSIYIYNGNITHSWPFEFVQKLSFENVEPIYWTIDASSTYDEGGWVEGDGLIEDGESVTLTAVPFEGYVFACWSDGTTKNPYTFTPTGNVELTALFLPETFSMTFIFDNGQDNVVKTQDYATELTAPPDPTKTGFTFKGWHPAVPAKVPASDVTFTAQWNRNVYAIIYMVHGKEWQRDSLAYEAPIQLRTYSEDGWTFNGWLNDATYVTMPAHDVVFTADITSGITGVFAGMSLVDVYTLQGHIVARRLHVAQLRKKLPRGVYVIEGMKMVIK